MDIQPYHKETEEIFWGESHIRNWLNKNFMEAAFISQEQQMIEAMKRLNVADNTYGMPENYTMDKYFYYLKKKYQKPRMHRDMDFQNLHPVMIRQEKASPVNMQKIPAGGGFRQ